MSGTISGSGFTGYPNQIFQVCALSLSWLQEQITSSSPAATAQQTINVFDTLRYAQQIIAAWQTANAWQTEFTLLQQVQAMPLTIDATASATFIGRINALTSAIPALNALLPIPALSTVVPMLQAGNLPLAYPGILEFYMGFEYETPPVGYATADTAAYAAQSAADWASIANAVLTYQSYAGLTQAYDEAARSGAAMNEISSTINALAETPFMSTFADVPAADAAYIWNQNVTVPALLFSASSIYGAPSTYFNQMCGVIRYVLGVAISSLALYIMSLRQPQFGQANTGVLLGGDSLMDFAARNTGNFEQWTQIAALNGLSAPWVGLPNSEPGANLLIPTTTGTAPATGLPTPSYAENVLGTDWNFGPMKTAIQAWTGDIPTISGSSNLRAALSRRIMTTLGTLIYHSTYGSRLPPMVGEVQDTTTANLVTAFGKSAILSDPRVQAVLSASTTLNSNGYGVDAFQADVQPIGTSGQSSVDVSANFILGPAA
jgi:hypothetical protein